MNRALRPSFSWVARLGVVSALVGIGAGIGGLAVSIALRGIEHLAYGYSAGTFLDGISQTPPWQRVAVLAIAGPWMLSSLVEYLQRMLQSIPTVVG